MKHANLSIFVPHAGCVHRCSFCNQRGISGTQTPPDGEGVRRLCEQAARELSGRECEIAFFGGSFTAVERAYQTELLEAAAPFLGDGMFSGVRISTRPDCITPEILSFLRGYGVTAIELGAQSMDDEVLAQNGRGHTAADVEAASGLITAGGFELGLQMMTGLPGSNARRDLLTARRLADLHPQTVRVYPTLVLEDTALAQCWRDGSYRPQTLDAAVELGGELLELFSLRGIRVIRMGLHAQDSLEQGLLAGPYHPAFRELCEGELLERQALAQLSGRPKGDYRLVIAPQAVSKITGHGARTIEKLRKMGYNIKIKQDSGVSGLTLHIEDV